MRKIQYEEQKLEQMLIPHVCNIVKQIASKDPEEINLLLNQRKLQFANTLNCTQHANFVNLLNY